MSFVDNDGAMDALVRGSMDSATGDLILQAIMTSWLLTDASRRLHCATLQLRGRRRLRRCNRTASQEVKDTLINNAQLAKCSSRHSREKNHPESFV